MPLSYFDEFNQNYEKPQVDGLIVGFSGIDPQKKNDAVALSSEQQDIIKQLILAELSGNSGCSCDTSNLSIEQQNIVDNIFNNKIKNLIIHYNGGEIIDPSDLDNYVDDDEAGDEAGDETGDETESSSGSQSANNTIIVDNSVYDSQSNNDVITDINPALINHELINGLLGGADNSHFHVTHDELKCLRLLISAFFPYFSQNSSEEALNNDPYTIVMPASIITPVNPITPVTPSDDIPTDPDDLAIYDPNFGMPSGTPPAWQILPFPSGFSADSGLNKIYYGGTPAHPYDNILVLYSDKKGNNDYIEAVLTSNDAQNWVTNNSEKIPFTTNMKTVFDLFLEPNYNFMYAIYENKSTSAKSPNCYYRSTSTASTFYSLEHPVSMCWAEPLNALLVAGKSGYATLMKFNTASIKYLKVSSIKNVGMPVNPRGAAFHPLNQVLCLCGSMGTAVSSDGENWFVNLDAPKNMTGLFYREDFNSFFAYSLDDKLFYSSNDGGNWSKAGNAPIPLDNITAVDFNPNTHVFCAVGTGDKGAYFSKDLNHWTFSGIRNTTTDIANLISLPDKGLYVAIPTSGSYYYTFDYNAWNNVQ